MTVTVTYQLTDLLAELNRAFNKFNEKYFEGKLEIPVIIVQSSRKRNTLGHFTVNRVWIHKTLTDEDFTTREKNAKHEISISAEWLNRPVEEVMATLIHEMVHLHCGLNNIKDTSNNCVYHNKRFKEEAEKRGLIIDKAPTIGWSVTTLQPVAKDYIKSLNINEAVFDYYRKGATFVPKVRITTLTKEEKLNRLYERLDKLKAKIKKVEIEE